MTSRLPPSDQFPTMPDERDMMSRGERVDRVLERNDGLLTRIDALSGACAQLLIRLGLTGIMLDTFTTDNGPRADMKRCQSVYDLQLRDAKSGS